MEPTLKNGDKVLVNRLSYMFKTPQKNNIVAVRVDGKIYIKRISKIENNTFFLTGDNANDSYDSRKYGMVGREQIIGKVIV